jgi:hypothetical protein
MLHKNIPANERHAPWSWEFADAAARLLAADFVEQDVGKVALDKDTKQAWILASTAPTWVPMGSGGEESVKSVAGKTGDVTLDKGDVGLGDVDNTSDANKPVSMAQQTALDSKQDTLISGTSIRTINGQSILGSGNMVVAGSGASWSWVFPTSADRLALSSLTEADLYKLGWEVDSGSAWVLTAVSPATWTPLNLPPAIFAFAVISVVSGVVTVKSSYNVASVTRINTGTYKVQFAAERANANYGMLIGTSQHLAASQYWYGTPYQTDPAFCIFNAAAISNGGALIDNFNATVVCVG